MNNGGNRAKRRGRDTGLRSALALTSAFAALTLCTAAPANAWECPGVTPEQIKICQREARETPTPIPASSTSSSDGGIGSWVSDHAGWIVLIVGGLIVWAVIAGLREDSASKRQERAAADAATLAHGRAIAADHHQAQVTAAHAAAPDPSIYDPMGMGVAAPAVEMQAVPTPSTDPEDLKRYAVFNAAVPWVPGSAFAAVVNRDGDWSRARGAWARACKQAGLGETDEADNFTPAATLDGLRTIGSDDDAVILAVRPAGLHVAERQLDRVREFLVVTAHVETASPFVREAATGLYLTTLRNTPEQQAAPAAEAAPPGPESWEW